MGLNRTQVESILEIDPISNQAQVSRRALPDQAWELDENSYEVEKQGRQGGELFLNLIENVDTTVDWETTNSCYRFFSIDTYTLHRSTDGSWTGESELNPVLQLDPSVEDCIYPLLARAPPKDVTCEEL